MTQGTGESRTDLVMAHLNRLLDGYRKLLVASTSFPALGPVDVQIETEEPARPAEEVAAEGAGALDTAPAPETVEMAETRPRHPRGGTSRSRRRWVSRRLVQFYAEIHVRRQLQHILRLLDREALRVGRDEETLRYRELRRQLQDHADRVTTWPGVARVIRALPVVPATTGLIVAWYIGFGESRPSGVQVLRALLGLALLILNCQILLVGPSIRLGFRAKRALFNGGITDMGPLVMWKWEVVGSRIRWRIPSDVSGYRLEDEVFHALGWAKRREPPLDLLLTLAHLGLLNTAAVFFAAAALAQDRDGFWAYLVLACAFLLFEALLLRAHWHTYRQRERLGEI